MTKTKLTFLKKSIVFVSLLIFSCFPTQVFRDNSNYDPNLDNTLLDSLRIDSLLLEIKQSPKRKRFIGSVIRPQSITTFATETNAWDRY